MDTRRSYDKTAAAYAKGVRGLFAPAPAAAAKRGAAAALTAARDLAAKAEALEPVSDDLTQAALIRLASDDPQERARASTDLLAKALSDLEISRLLYEEASRGSDQSASVSAAAPAAARLAKRGAGPPAVLDYLDILTHKTPSAPRAAATKKRGPSVDARTQLADDASAAFGFIPKTAASTGQSALNGLLGLGMKNLAQAAGAVGMDIARYLGIGGWVSRLYQLFQRYVVKAYETIIALIGNQVAKEMADKVLKWFEEVKAGTKFEELLNGLYQTEKTKADVAKTIQQSQAGDDSLTGAAADVAALRGRFESNMGLADKLIKGLGYLAWVHLTALPQAQLLMAATYIALGAYAILAGGDAVDAPALQRFDYTLGVVEILKARKI